MPKARKSDHAEVGVAHHHRIRRAPFQIGELFRVDEIDFGFKRRVEAMFPGAELRQDRRVTAVDRVATRAETDPRSALRAQKPPLAIRARLAVLRF